MTNAFKDSFKGSLKGSFKGGGSEGLRAASFRQA